MKHGRNYYDLQVQAPLNQQTLHTFVQHSVIKDIQISVAEEQKIVQRYMPHFTIRMIQKLETLVEEGIMT